LAKSPLIQLVGSGKSAKISIEHHCMDCNTVLACEVTDRLGFNSFTDYYWLKNGVWLKERWYGNWVKCPSCGLEGTLPLDKPLSAEAILDAKPTPEDIELDKSITATLEAKIKKVKGDK